MKKIKVFLHLTDISGSEAINREIFDTIIESKLHENAEINIFCNYNETSFQWLKNEISNYQNIILHFDQNSHNDFEFPTLNKLKSYCDSIDDTEYILYLHQKGITSIGNVCVDDWRKLLLKFNVSDWKNCVDKLDEGYDTVGCLWKKEPYNHFSGNFWWANSNYIKSLPKIEIPSKISKYESQFGFETQYPLSYRYDCEFWIGLNNPKFYNFYECNFNLYQERCWPTTKLQPKKKIMVATPMYGSMCTSEYMSSMLSLFENCSKMDDIELTFVYGINEALITKSRNGFVNLFLKSDCTHLLFIDSDIKFNPHEIIQMLKTKEDFVCGIYPKKKIDWSKIKQAAVNGVSHETLPGMSNEYLFVPLKEKNETVEGLVEIEKAATGMMLLSRDVFDMLAPLVDTYKLEEPINNNLYKFIENQNYREYFFTGKDPKTDIFLHEDYNFCKIWRSVGGKIYGAPWVKLFHVGSHVFG